jgi:hypothetical protein
LFFCFFFKWLEVLQNEKVKVLAVLRIAYDLIGGKVDPYQRRELSQLQRQSGRQAPRGRKGGVGAAVAVREARKERRGTVAVARGDEGRARGGASKGVQPRELHAQAQRQVAVREQHLWKSKKKMDRGRKV